MDLFITILPVVTKDLPIAPRSTPCDFLLRCKFSNLTTREPMVIIVKWNISIDARYIYVISKVIQFNTPLLFRVHSRLLCTDVLRCSKLFSNNIKVLPRCVLCNHLKLASPPPAAPISLVRPANAGTSDHSKWVPRIIFSSKGYVGGCFLRQDFEVLVVSSITAKQPFGNVRLRAKSHLLKASEGDSGSESAKDSTSDGASGDAGPEVEAALTDRPTDVSCEHSVLIW